MRLASPSEIAVSLPALVVTRLNRRMLALSSSRSYLLCGMQHTERLQFCSLARTPRFTAVCVRPQAEAQQQGLRIECACVRTILALPKRTMLLSLPLSSFARKLLSAVTSVRTGKSARVVGQIRGCCAVPLRRAS